MHDPYHPGEIAVQERQGDRAVALRRSRMIGDRLETAACRFLAQQGPMAVGAVDPEGALWTSLWHGLPGWLRSEETGERIQVSAAEGADGADPVRPIIRVGAPLAMLVIDFVARLRLRINGTVARVDTLGVELQVRETFGNCGKYIQQWRCVVADHAVACAHVQQGRMCDEARLHRFARTDTAFVTTIHPGRGLDVSHRGGEPGFIRPEGGGLRIPEYAGNGMYQTLGNLEIDERASLALVDFEGGRILSLSGRATRLGGASTTRRRTGENEPSWEFTPDRWMEYPLRAGTRWTLLGRSPFNPPAPCGTTPL